jgi:membrane fusion protein, multidrug efflux system
MPHWERLVAASGLFPPAPAKRDKPPTPVSTAKVVQRDMPLYLNGLGTVTAFKTVTIRSRVEGELTHVAFQEGQLVNEGDLLAQIDPRPFVVQRDQAAGQLARDEATLKSAKLTLSRYEGLLASKSISAQQYDEQAVLVQQTMAAIQTDQALVASAELQITYCGIVAPIRGRIGLRLVDKGNIVRANDPTGLAVITQLQPIALVFTIPQDDIGRVQRRMGGGHELPVDAFDRDLKLKLASGRLLAIDNQVDSTTGTVRLKAVFENEDGMLFPNQFVNARLLVDTKANAIVVPSAAVQRGPASMFVYIVKDDETVELRNVVTGPTEGSDTSIESGLEAGEIVVTDGIDKLRPGAKISTRAQGKDKSAKKDAKPQTEDRSPRGERRESTGKPNSSSSDGNSTPPSDGHGPEKAEAKSTPSSDVAPPSNADSSSTSAGPRPESVEKSEAAGKGSP